MMDKFESIDRVLNTFDYLEQNERITNMLNVSTYNDNHIVPIVMNFLVWKENQTTICFDYLQQTEMSSDFVRMSNSLFVDDNP